MALFRIWPIRPAERLRWDPWREIEEFRREMERLTQRSVRRFPARDAAGIAFEPEMDLFDTGAVFLVKADLPGVKGENLEISIEGNVLSIRGYRAADGGVTCLSRERPAGRFARTIELPGNVAVERVEATLSHGVLEITLPKSQTTVGRNVHVADAEEDRVTVARVKE